MTSLRKRTPEPAIPSLPTLHSAIEAPLIRYLVADHGLPKVRAQIMLMLSQFCEIVTVNTPQGTAWIEAFAHDFLEKYDCESLEDFALFIQMLRRAELGPIYAGRMDGAVLFERFTMYLDKKAAERENQHREKSAQAMEEMRGAVNGSPSMRKLAADLVEKFRAEEIQRQRDKSLKTERHKSEGFLAVDKAKTLDDLRLIWSHYPYEGVRTVAQAKAEELKAAETSLRIVPVVQTEKSIEPAA